MKKYRIWISDHPMNPVEYELGQYRFWLWALIRCWIFVQRHPCALAEIQERQVKFPKARLV